MTEDRIALADLMAKSGDGDFLRSVAESVLQIIMEADVDGLIGAGRHERSGERSTWRNGYRDRSLETRLGTLNLKIPKLRTGTYFPGFLEPRKTVEKALVSVIQEAWIAGVSTRRVDDLVQAMGMTGISKSSVSKLCKDIDERVNAFLKRPLAGEWPYLWLDATYLKVREGGPIVSVAAIIAVAVNTEGRREIVGLHIGPSEAEPFWSTFLRDLVRRGLKGVKLVISDAHEGLKAAVTRVIGATWQRCRVHFMRNALAHVPKSQNTMVAAAIRQVFLQPDHVAATQSWRHVADQLRARWPKLGTCMDDAEHDVLAYMTFPEQHRVKLHSTNPLERLNKEVKRRADVVGMLASPPFGSPTRTASIVSSGPSCSNRTTNISCRTATCRSRAWPPSPHPKSRRSRHSRLHQKPPDHAARCHTPKLHHIDGRDRQSRAGILCPSGVSPYR
jgi:transposase-like protein